MKKHIIGIVCGLVMMGLSSVDAKIATPTVALSGTSNIKITWPALEQTEIDKGFTGYAIQWNEDMLKMDNDDSMRLTVPLTTLSHEFSRVGLEANTPIYFRVYAYFTGSDNKKYYTHGSDIVNFTYATNNTATSTLSTRTDTIIYPSSITATSTANADTTAYTFPNMTFKKYDTFAIATFGSPYGVPTTYLDGYFIDISESSTFSTLVAKADLSTPDLRSVKFTNLKPNTTYYIRASYYENTGSTKRTFGTSSTYTIKTIAALTLDQKAKLDILVRQKRINLSADKTVDTLSSTSTSTTTTATTSTNTTSTSTNTGTIDYLNTTNTVQLDSEIRRVEAYLSQLRTRRAALTVSGTTTTTATTTSTSSTSGTLTSRRFTIRS